MCDICKNWARTFDEILISDCHPDCENRKIEFGSCKRGFNSSWLSHLHQSFGCNVFERKEG